MGKKRKKEGARKGGSRRFLIILGLLVAGAFAAKTFVYSDDTPAAGGYRSNESGILYDYTPEAFEAALKSGKPTILDLSADWCPPCRITAPILEKLRGEYRGEVNIFTANADKERDLVLRYREEWFPAFIFFDRDGNEVRRVRGLIFEEDFRLAIEELLHEDSLAITVETVAPETVLNRLMAGERLTLIDVRTPQEFDSGHIPGAINIPLDRIDEASLRDRGISEDQEVIVYCQGGVRSHRAARILYLMGYRKVRDMGGILDWNRIGGPVVRS
ncbi:MAG: hypothetical protein D6733_03710 [Methanobacteriota archaeon]|nr:MAG: hypothetical protein D6733_03710 [Euryarchaeota archaeon]